MRAQRAIDENSSSMIIWRGRGAVSELQCASGLLAEIAELAMSGYTRYPWGGVEIGGVLFGKRESETVRIHSFRPADCEHHYGPAFDLSEKDYDRLRESTSCCAGGRKACWVDARRVGSIGQPPRFRPVRSCTCALSSFFPGAVAGFYGSQAVQA